MMKTINKNIRREFKMSLGRFLSVSALLMLGVFVLIGLNVTGPNMRQTAQKSYETENLADAKITSTLALDQADRQYLKKRNQIKTIEFGHTTDVLIKGSNHALRVETTPHSLSKLVLTKGHKPANRHQIVLSDSLRGQYKLNEIITIKAAKDDHKLVLKQTKFKIVGFATSTEYLKKDNVGSTAAGTGELYGFAYVNKQAFSSKDPNVARVAFKGVSGNAYSDKYEKKTADIAKSLQAKLNKHNDVRVRRLRQTLNDDIASITTKITSSTARLVTTTTQLEVSQENLTTQLNAAKAANNTDDVTQLQASQAKLDQQKVTLKKQQTALAQAEDKLTSAKNSKEQLSDISLTIQNRNDYNAGYNNYGEDAQRIDALGKSFPVFFFLIAILVSFTTMRRMVEEKRIEMGTLRALGYSKGEVMREFLVYSISTALTGTILGSILGLVILPQIIFRAYTANFTFKNLLLSLHPGYIILSFLIAFLSTVLASWLAARKTLETIPAELMLPKPPAKGSRILLEQITPIWRRLSFSHKVTARNLFRYKGRMLMTITGVAGATALMITGFGIRDSLNTIVDRQFGQISQYDLITAYNPNTTTNNVVKAKKTVTNSNKVHKYTSAYFADVYATRRNDYAREEISLMVPTKTATLDQYIKLRDYKTDKKLHFSDSGAIVSEKLAKLQNATVGDHIVIHDNDGTAHKIKIAGITTMYAGHYVYMNRAYYAKVYNQSATDNAYLVKLKHATSKRVNSFAANFNHHDAAVKTIQAQEAKATITNILNNLNNLIIVLVLSASLLSLVVLYTLTNINVSERVRELSTLKVLGFYPREVLMYIYRETNILTGAGILVGIGIGYAFHAYIMSLLPPATAMVAPGLMWSNVIISVILTIIFSIIVMIIMNHKIESVDMLEALKSVD